MYEEFFGLKRRPFSPTPDANCFVPLETHQGALDALAVSCERGQGISVLTGEAGLGKTLVGLRLAFELEPTFATAFLRHSAYATRRALLQAILFELNLPYERKADQELRLELTAALQSMRTEKLAFALIVDEAHRLSAPLLDELRLLTLLSEAGQPLARLVLVGNRDLEERLADPELAAFNQRICCQVDLAAMTQSESLEYLRANLEFAGGTASEIFTDEALAFLAKAADGVPRCLNHLADHALLLAYVAEQRPVSIDIVRNALADLKQLPLQWNDPISGGEIYRGRSSLPQLEDSAVDLWPEKQATTGNSPQQTNSWNEDAFSESSAAIEIGGDLDEGTTESQNFETDSTLTEQITCLKDDWQEISRESSSVQKILDDVEALTQTLEETADSLSLGQTFAAHELEFGSPTPESFAVEEFAQQKKAEADERPSDQELHEEPDLKDWDSDSEDERELLWNSPNHASSADDSAEIEFEEEPVLDRYVRIETGGSHERVIGTYSAMQPKAAAKRTVTVVKTTPLIIPVAESTSELQQRLEAKSELADCELESGIVETYSRSSREAVESVEEPEEAVASHEIGDSSCSHGQAEETQQKEQRRDWHLPTELLRATLEDDGLEEQIGADVLDLYLDVQQSMLDQRRASERTTVSLDKPNQEEPPCGAEPSEFAARAEPINLDDTIERAEIPRATQPGAIQRAYGRLFSELRRRQR